MFHCFARLRFQLILLVFLAVLPALGIILYTGLERQRQAAASAQEEAQMLVKHASKECDRTILMTRQLLLALAAFPSVAGRDGAASSALFADLLQIHPGYANLGAVDPQGDMFASALPMKGPVKVTDRSWFQRVLQTGDFAIGDLMVGRVTGKTSVICAQPVRDKAGRLQAIVFAALDMAWLGKLVPITELPGGSVFTIIDHQGHILARYPHAEQWVGKTIQETELFKTILAQKTGVAEARGIDGTLRLYAFAPLDFVPQGGFINIGVPAAAVYAEAQQTLTRNLIGLGVAGGLALMAALALGHLLITRRMNRLLRAAQQLAAGDLGARTDLIHSQGEIGKLAGAFDHMAAALESQVKAQRESEAKYRTLVEQMPAVSYSLALDEGGAMFYISPQVEAWLGFSAAELLADPGFLRKRLHPDDRERVSAELARSRDTGEPFASEYRLVVRSGAVVWVRDQATPVCLNNGQPLFLQGVILDITAGKQAEEDLETANEKLKIMVDQAEQRNRKITLVQEMSDMLQSCQSSQEAYVAFSRYAPKIFPQERGALYVVNNSKNLLEVVAAWGESPLPESGFGPDECWAMRRGRIHAVKDPGRELLCQHVSHDRPSAYLCVPMLAQGEALGIIYLETGSPDRRMPDNDSLGGAAEDEPRLAMTLAENLGLALANLKLRETLQHQAIRDPLTGLFNRRYLEETLGRELNRAQRAGAPVGVVMMDLDHFKQFNDTYGHSAGDALLSAVGALLQKDIRREDIACRYGGEEFVIIMPGASLEVTLDRAEKLQKMIKKLQVGYRGKSLPCTTISAGVAVFPDHGPTGEALIQKADAAMYRAKLEGRDRTVAVRDLENLERSYG
jgi:diguanylate cyclase (GGDEF)-like protein/PAS domain S-box-containing protein